jgi:hypothetical protein
MTTLEDFTKNLLLLMEETFGSKRYGIYLDEGTSLFETLDTVSAAEASIPSAARVRLWCIPNITSARSGKRFAH